MTRQRPKLDVLQAGRGIAALLVVLFHANVIFTAAKYWGHEAWPGFRMGHAGVEFFFVLSGFIITHIHLGEVGKPSALPRFALKRLVRIYPAYWAALALVIATLFASPAADAGASRAPMALLQSALLVPTAESPHLKVAWTLRHELLFYLLFAALLANRRLGLAVLGLWFAGCAVWSVVGADTFPGSFYLATFNLLFPMGMACAWTLQHRSVPAPAVVALGGIGIFAAAGMADVVGGPGRLLTIVYGIGSALAILGLVELERSRDLRVPRPLTVLGDASYSVYLIHYLALSVTAKALSAAGLITRLPPVLAFVLLVAAGVSTGLVFRLLVEKPAVDWLARVLIPSRRASEPGPELQAARPG
ncbi:acyltransferase family protein [Parablastomonas sp. CN1-191]|uniref:acyltransferase family protein n=1 Tax=Parablastomonas sp. CN1-191 TaxID=3400908 RepID=UPI003BF7C9B0